MTSFRFAALSFASLLTLTTAALSQENTGEGMILTQTLIHTQSKADVVPTATELKLQVESKDTPLLSLVPVKPSGVQIALLIDDGLSRSAGIQLNDIKQFIASVPPGTEVLVGYMAYGTVKVASPFSTDRNAAAEAVRLPTGLPGESASPYFCLSEFAKQWPEDTDANGKPKARIAIMLTNGVDPYNGSTRLSNQDSPYVQAAVNNAERAGIAVYSIYYRDAGFRGGSASLSGQSYLQQVADSTGGESYYEGTGSPVSLTPFFKQFLHDISETYVASFNAPATGGGRDHLVRLKVSSVGPKVKVRHADEVRPGNLEQGQ